MLKKVTTKKNQIVNKVANKTNKIVEDQLKDTTDLKAIDVKVKDSQYVTGAKTHPDYFDEMTPELISALDRPTLKSRTADYIAYLNLKDKQMTLKDLRLAGATAAIVTLASASSHMYD